MAPTLTDAERALSELFEARSGSFTDGPLDRRRAEAFKQFAAGGLPHRRVEAYKYTDLRSRLRRLPAPAEAASVGQVEAILNGYPPLVTNAHRLILANGRFMPTLSSAPAGITITSILAPEADLTDVGALTADSDDPVTLANVGLFDGGAVVPISENPAAPLELVHVVTGDVIAMDRVAISLPAGLEASIIERTIGADHSVTNNMAEIVIGDGAVLHFTRVSDGLSDNATELSSHHIRMGTKSRLEHLTISTGRGLARNQVFCHVDGDDSDANFRTATISTGRRHADTTLVVRHDSVGARSTEVFRSAVGRKGTAIVQGRIIVERDAQQTDSRMMSNALFLDDSGEMVNKPELEIFADDVQCGHGATSGDLEEDHVFYLRARGIPAALARQMLVEAFLIEALDAVQDEALEEVLEKHIRTALAAIQPEGEPA